MLILFLYTYLLYSTYSCYYEKARDND